MQNKFDTGPLSWVMGETREAFSLTKKALSSLAEQNVESQLTSLKHAKTYLHQVHGALQMVDVDGVGKLLDAIEALLDQPDMELDRFNSIADVLDAIQIYLDELLVSAVQKPVRLFPYYRKLLELKGEASAHPVDLFFPDLSAPNPIPLQLGEKNYREDHQTVPADVAALRKNFEKALLPFLKQTDNDLLHTSVQQMQQVIVEIWLAQTNSRARSFWAAIHACIELVDHQRSYAEQSVRQLFGRINLQLRRLVEGVSGISESLLREALFFIARASNLPSNALAVFNAYQLEGQVPADFEQQFTAGKAPGALSACKEQLAQIKTLWGKVVSVEAGAAENFQRGMQRFGETCSTLSTPLLSATLPTLSRHLVDLFQRVSQDNPSEAFAVDMAASLLFIESALESTNLPVDFSDRANALIARMTSRANGQELGGVSPWLDEMSQKVQQNQTMAVIVEEMQSSLRVVEKTLDAYFRSPSEISELAQIDPIIHQLSGALAILDQDEANRALVHTQAIIHQIAQTRQPVDSVLHTKIAQNIGVLGFLIETLQKQPDVAKDKFSFDTETGYFTSHLFDVPKEPEFVEEFDNLETQTELLADLEDEQSVARVLDNEYASHRAVQAIEAHAQTEIDASKQQVDKIIHAVEEARDAEYMSNSPVPIDDEAADAELLEVFLMEAEEVLVCINDAIPLSRKDPGNQDYLITLRRSFHTLKGSSRMVGLGLFGNAAWNIEQVMNGWLAAADSGTDDLYALLEKAAEIFGRWVADLNAMGTSDDDGQALIDAAQRIKNGGTYSYEEQAEAVAEPAQKVEVLDAQIIDFPSNLTPVLAPENELKKIGSIEISVPLYNVYLAETDEIVRFLSRDFSEWRHEPQRPASTNAVHAAHSLAGSSATVGFVSLQEIAHALEMLLQHLEHHAVSLLPGEFDTLDRCIASIKAMLHQFALSEMTPPQPQQVLVLEQLLSMLKEREQPPEVKVAPVPSVPVDKTSLMVVLPEDDIDMELLPVFLEEGSDLFPQIGQTLRHLQAEPHNKEIMQSLLRLLHTVKGSARMAGAMALGQHTHDMESQVENIMQAGISSGVVLDGLLARHDMAMAMFDQLRLLGAPSPEMEQSIVAEVVTNDAPASTNVGNTGLVRVRADILDRLVNQAGEISISRSRIENEIGALRSSLVELTENINRLRDQLREVEIQAETQISSRLSMSGERGFDPLEFDRYTRLQELTRMMAESVSDVSSVQNNIVKTVTSATDDLFKQAHITRELQQDLMRVRMVPFARISERLYRITRQASKELDKRVDLDIRGMAVEIDRNVLEKISAPFEHLLRNAIVHGIESREQRLASGKSEVGEIVIQIRQEGNEVVINFNDDGQGLDLRKIRDKAHRLGLLAEGEEVTDAEAMNLIFESGFSTSHEVTTLAGRGIGMDVVRSEVTALGGRVSVTSTAGLGCNFTIHLPLTLAVTQVVLLHCAHKTYAVPSVLVEQVLQLKTNELVQAHNEGTITWHGQRIALHYLSVVLGDLTALPLTQKYTPVLIMRSGDERVALHVDQVMGNREVVVKNIGPQLARMIGISGATVLGSGDIVLILNPIPLVKKSGHDALRTPHLLQEKMTSDVGSESPGMRRNPIVMVVDDSLTMRRVTQRLLVREGYQVVLAKDGVDALQQLQEITPDVMLVDIEMPRMDGFDLTRNVRNDERLKHIPIIVITSRTADKHRNYARELGVNAYFGKPYQEEALLRAIVGYLPVAAQ